MRTGEEKALVQAVFEMPDGAKALLDELGVEVEDGLIALTREVSAAGRSVSHTASCTVPRAAPVASGSLGRPLTSRLPGSAR